MPEAPEWLEPSTVRTVLGSMAEQLDDNELVGLVPGVRDWVEDKRRDLVDDMGLFQPTQSVTLGAALLVLRVKARRTTPLGVLGASEDGYAGIIRDDPDIARFLGIGTAGKFVFGGHNPTTTQVVI